MSNEEEENRGFKITDRRMGSDEEVPEQTEFDSEKQREAEPSVPPPAEAASESEPAPPQEPLPPLDFAQFVLSLASSAMIHLGEADHPADGKRHEDLAGAQQSIDILAMLEEKTRGNLSREEESLLKSILADLRIRFVQKKPKK